MPLTGLVNTYPKGLQPWLRNAGLYSQILCVEISTIALRVFVTTTKWIIIIMMFIKNTTSRSREHSSSSLFLEFSQQLCCVLRGAWVSIKADFNQLNFRSRWSFPSPSGIMVISIALQDLHDPPAFVMIMTVIFGNGNGLHGSAEFFRLLVFTEHTSGI